MWTNEHLVLFHPRLDGDSVVVGWTWYPAAEVTVVSAGGTRREGRGADSVLVRVSLVRRERTLDLERTLTACGVAIFGGLVLYAARSGDDGVVYSLRLPQG